jgi:hypothetical protein
MPTMIYTNLAEAVAIVQTKATAGTAEIEALLAVTAGFSGATMVYRPYFVAAGLLSDPNRVQSHQGTAFVNLQNTIEGLLKLQAGIDGSLGLTVPAGSEATLKPKPPISGAIPLKVVL